MQTHLSGVLPPGWGTARGQACVSTDLEHAHLSPLPARREPSFLFASPRLAVCARASSPRLLQLTWLCLARAWEHSSPGKGHARNLPGGGAPARAPWLSGGRGETTLRARKPAYLEQLYREVCAQHTSHPLPAHNAETSVQLHDGHPPGWPILEPSIPPETRALGVHPRQPTPPGPGSQRSARARGSACSGHVTSPDAAVRGPWCVASSLSTVASEAPTSEQMQTNEAS